MGPKGFKKIQETLKAADLTILEESRVRADAYINPEVSGEGNSVPFVEVRCGDEKSPGDILNALAPMVTMDTKDEGIGGIEVKFDETLLRPVNIGKKAILFQDVHYPHSH